MATTNIEWTATDGIAGMTWNPVTGCTYVSEGCRFCYASKMTHRLEHMGEAKYRGLTVLNTRGERHFNGVVRTHDDALRFPLKWRKPRRVFVNSMSDLFHRDVPFEFIDQVFAVMALCQQHTFMVLTKRPERMEEYMNRREISAAWSPSPRGPGGGDEAYKWKTPADRVYREVHHSPHAKRIVERGMIWPLPNVWAGTSVENQNAADGRIPHLLKVPAAVRFLSCEPLLGPLDNLNLDGIQLVIAGGESGHGARPCDIDWIRDLRDQCKAAGVAFFNKQLGSRNRCEHSAKGGCLDCMPDDLRIREFPEVK